MTAPLASVSRLSVRLGAPIDPDSPDHARATEALWSASVQARSIAQQAEWTTETDVPDAVLDVILGAALRLFKNPDRFVVNQAGSFQATLATSDFASGSIFLAGEIAVLNKYRPAPGVRVTAVYRDDPDELSGPYDAANYVADPTNLGLGDPFYGFEPNGPRW